GVEEVPAVRGEERPVVRLPRVDVGGQLDREAGPARDVEHLEEAGTLVAVVGLAVEERVLIGPPLRHGRVAAARLCGAVRPRREVPGGSSREQSGKNTRIARSATPSRST